MDMYSIGDINFLANIFNGVAALTSDGTLNSLFKIGFMIGLLAFIIQGIASAGKNMPIVQSFIAIIIFMIFFGPTTNIRINSVYNGDVREVANVPFGLAWLASSISKVGFGLADGTETAFAPTLASTSTYSPMTDNGFAAPLKALVATRSVTSFGTANCLNPIAPACSGIETQDEALKFDNLENSVKNYVRDCTMTGVKRGELSLAGIMRNRDTISAMRWGSTIYGTSLQMPEAEEVKEKTSEDGYEVNCTVAWDLIRQRIDPDNDAFMLNFYKSQAPSMGTQDVQDYLVSAVEALNGSYGEAHADAALLLINAVNSRLIEEGYNERGFVDGDLSRFAKISASTEFNTNLISSTQSDLFGRMIQPLLTFFEGFIFGIAPMMPLLIGLGFVGMKMLGKYFLTLIWIQLWLVTAIFCHLFVYMSAAGEMANLQASGVELISIYGMNIAGPKLNNYLGIGGLMMSSVPALTLFLIYGTSMAAVNLAGRFDQSSVSRSDTMPALGSAPDIYASEAAFAQGGQGQAIRPGSLGSVAPSFSMAVANSGALSNAESSRQSSLNSFARNLSQTSDNAWSTGEGETFNAALSQALRASGQDTFTGLSRDMMNSTKSWGLDQSRIDSMLSQAGVSLGGNSGKIAMSKSGAALIQNGKNGASTLIAANGQVVTGDQALERWKQEEGSSQAKEFSISQQASSSLLQETASAVQSNATTTFASNQNFGNTTGLTSSAQQAVEASKVAQSVQQMTNQMATDLSGSNPGTVFGNIANSDRFQEAYNQLATNPSIADAMRQATTTPAYQNIVGQSAKQAAQVALGIGKVQGDTPGETANLQGQMLSAFAGHWGISSDFNGKNFDQLMAAGPDNQAVQDSASNLVPIDNSGNQEAVASELGATTAKEATLKAGGSGFQSPQNPGNVVQTANSNYLSDAQQTARTGAQNQSANVRQNALDQLSNPNRDYSTPKMLGVATDVMDYASGAANDFNPSPDGGFVSRAADWLQGSFAASGGGIGGAAAAAIGGGNIIEGWKQGAQNSYERFLEGSISQQEFQEQIATSAYAAAAASSQGSYGVTPEQLQGTAQELISGFGDNAREVALEQGRQMGFSGPELDLYADAAQHSFTGSTLRSMGGVDDITNTDNINYISAIQQHHNISAEEAKGIAQIAVTSAQMGNRGEAFMTPYNQLIESAPIPIGNQQANASRALQ